MLLPRQSRGGAGPSSRGLGRLVASGPRRGRSLSRARPPAKEGDGVRSRSVRRPSGPDAGGGEEGGKASGAPPRAPRCDGRGRCPSHPFVQLRRYSDRTGRWMVLLDGCPMCAIEAAAGDGGPVRLRARSRSSDPRGGEVETSYCPMADGGGGWGDDPDGEEPDAPEGGERPPSRASRSKSRPRMGRLGGRPRSRSRAAARAVGRLLRHGRLPDVTGGTAGGGASPEDKGGEPEAGRRARKSRPERHDGDDARSSATLTTECSSRGSRDCSLDDGEDDDGDSVATEESAVGREEDLGESIVVSDLERQLYGSGAGYDVDDYIPMTAVEEEEGERAAPAANGESFPELVRRGSVEVLPGDSIDDIARKNEMMVRMLHQSGGSTPGGSGEGRRRRARRRGSDISERDDGGASSSSAAAEEGRPTPARDERLAGSAAVSPRAGSAGEKDDGNADDGAVGTNEWDSSGRCVRHGHVRLRKRRVLGKGWNVLMSACPECCVDELRRAREGSETAGGDPQSPAAAPRRGPPSGGSVPRRASCPDGAARGTPPGQNSLLEQTPPRESIDKAEEPGTAAAARGTVPTERGAPPTAPGGRRRASLEPLAGYIRRRRSRSRSARGASRAASPLRAEAPSGQSIPGGRGASLAPRPRRSSLEPVAESPVPGRRGRSRSVVRGARRRASSLLVGRSSSRHGGGGPCLGSRGGTAAGGHVGDDAAPASPFAAERVDLGEERRQRSMSLLRDRANRDPEDVVPQLASSGGWMI